MQGWALFAYEGNIGFQLGDGDYQNYLTSELFADGEWHHVAVTVDRDKADGLNFYLDKQLVKTSNPTSIQGSVSNAVPFTIGRRSDSSDAGWLRGGLDQIKLFNRALSTAEIQKQ